MKDYKFDGLKRINKTVARKMYNEGKDVLFIPCNCNPNRDVWGLSIWENKDNWGQFPDFDAFDTLVLTYISYNCNNELGKYPAFYIKK